MGTTLVYQCVTRVPLWYEGTYHVTLVLVPGALGQQIRGPSGVRRGGPSRPAAPRPRNSGAVRYGGDLFDLDPQSADCGSGGGGALATGPSSDERIER